MNFFFAQFSHRVVTFLDPSNYQHRVFYQPAKILPGEIAHKVTSLDR